VSTTSGLSRSLPFFRFPACCVLDDGFVWRFGALWLDDGEGSKVDAWSDCWSAEAARDELG
jgi:hypothetical protein